MSDAKSKCMAFLRKRPHYYTPKVVRVTNPYITVIYWTSIFSIVAYIVLYNIWWCRGYNAFEVPTGTVTSKVKGVAYSGNHSHIESEMLDFTPEDILESNDLSRPASEANVLFIGTSMIQTYQHLDQCASEKSYCTHNDNCTANKFSFDGVATGVCLHDEERCEEVRWCPPEDDENRENDTYSNVENFSIFLKVFVDFWTYGSYVNLISEDGSLEVGYNLFFVEDILEEVGSTIDDVIDYGAVITCTIRYDCDFNFIEQCDPMSFQWERIDNIEDSVSPGFNFRETIYYTDDDSGISRLLIKNYGLRFFFTIVGQGEKFNLLQLLLNLGAGLGLMAVSNVASEILMRYFVPERQIYNEKRIVTITPEEEMGARLSLKQKNAPPLDGKRDTPTPKPVRKGEKSTFEPSVNREKTSPQLTEGKEKTPFSTIVPRETINSERQTTPEPSKGLENPTFKTSGDQERTTSEHLEDGEKSRGDTSDACDKNNSSESVLDSRNLEETF